MAKLWAGRSQGELDKSADDFNSSIHTDIRMVYEDIKGSIAHAQMLGAKGIIPQKDSDAICDELEKIAEDLKSGALKVDYSAEDVHTFIEAELTSRLGDAGKKLHTARSRNDQVALDLRMFLLSKNAEIKAALKKLIEVIVDKAEKYSDAIMPGYTHLQRAQPVTFGHHLLAYANMFLRDIGRLDDCAKRTAVLPLGSAALAGTTYPIDRKLTAELLGFSQVGANSLDCVSDRDFVIELQSALAVIMTHLSRFSEEIILWCSWEFKFMELSDAYSTGSSIMPQKKNPDMAELVRGKTGRVYGNLFSILTVMKGLPLAYNKDMQEDKEGVFDSIDTVLDCLNVFAPMLEGARVNTDNMLKAAKKGFINATDCADYLTKKGVAFRDAYKITGRLVAYAIEHDKALDDLTLGEFGQFSDVFKNDIFEAIDMVNCVKKRTSEGGASPDSVRAQIASFKTVLKQC